VANVVHRAMEIHPADRFTSMHEIAVALGGAAEDVAPRVRIEVTGPRPRPGLIFAASMVAVLAAGAVAMGIATNRTGILRAASSEAAAPAPPSVEPPPAVVTSETTRDADVEVASPPTSDPTAHARPPPVPWRPRSARLELNFFVFADPDAARHAGAKLEPALLACFLREPVHPRAYIDLTPHVLPSGRIDKPNAHPSCKGACDGDPSAAVTDCVVGVLTSATFGPLDSKYPVGVNIFGDVTVK
jgi:hypothetical protein